MEEKKSNIKLIIKVSVGTVLAVLVALGIVKYLIDNSTKKLYCKSSYGTITLVYNKKEIISYEVTDKLTFNYEVQNQLAKEIGTESYINQFITAFVTDFNGYCK